MTGACRSRGKSMSNRQLKLIGGDYYAAQMKNYLLFKFQIFSSPATQALTGVNKMARMHSPSGRALR